jgi:hypothetical protein
MSVRAELRTKYGPRRPSSAHLNGQPWIPATSSSRPRSVEARSGGQGVASSNLASPTIKHLVRAHFRARGTLRLALKKRSFQVHFRCLRWSSPESMRSGPCTLLGRSQIDADVDEHRVPQRGSGIHWSHARPIHGHGESAADQVGMDHPNLAARVNLRKLSEYSSGRTGFPNGSTSTSPVSAFPTGQIHQMLSHS